MENQALVMLGNVFEMVAIDTMADDMEMDSEDIATELVACGYTEEEADRLSLRPWKEVQERRQL